MTTLQHPLPGGSLSPGRHYGGGHTGIDLIHPGGTCGRRVVAAGDGIARRSENLGGGHGVVIDHGGGVETGYWHVATRLIRNGQRVRAGQAIALAGATGTLVRGCNLHFEVKVNGANVDPLPAIGGRSVGGSWGPADPTFGELTPESPPGTFPDVMGSGGGRCDVAAGWRDASALETFIRPELVGQCYRVTPGEIAGGIAGAAVGEALTTALPVLANGAIILVALVLGWTGVKQTLGLTR